MRFLIERETSGEEKSHESGEDSETAENSEKIQDSGKSEHIEKSQNSESMLTPSTENLQMSLSSQNVDSVTANTEIKGKEKKRRSRRKLVQDTEKIQNEAQTQGPEELLNTEVSILTPNSQNLQLSENIDSVTMEEGDGKENRRRSRRRLMLQRQDAEEVLESTPMITRSRRTVKTPASEKVNITRASRTKK